MTTIAEIMPVSASVAFPTLLRFGVAALLIELTPGPNMGYLVIVAAQRGRVAGLFVVAGVAVGLSCYLAATVAGVAQGALDNAIVYQALRWSGIGYMLWLAVDAWRAGPSADTTEPPLGKARLFGRGLLANLLNVKAAIFYALMLPGFIDVSRGRLALQALVLGAAHLLIATTVHVGIVLLAARSARLLPEGGSRCIGKAYAGALLLVALWLGWSTRQHAM